jgi:hypothetical protein
MTQEVVPRGNSRKVEYYQDDIKTLKKQREIGK